jgi:PPOX class probable F420-dependent enzyme
VPRKDITMTDRELAAFLAEGRVIQVASNGHDGYPHVAPMWYVIEDGRVVFRSFTKSQKMINLARDPRVTLLLETGDAYAELRGAMIKGTAHLDADPERVLRLYGAMAAKYAMVGDEPVELDPEALEAAFGRFASKNTAVTVVPERIVTWDHTKLGGAY